MALDMEVMREGALWFLPQAFRVELPSDLSGRRGVCYGSDAADPLFPKI